MEAIADTDVAELPPELRARALAVNAEKFTTSNDPNERFRLALELAENGETDGERRLKQVLTELPESLVRELSNYSLRRAIDVIRRNDERWASEHVARWITEGALWSGAWRPIVKIIPEAFREELFDRVTTEYDLAGDAVGVLAATADPGFARRAFESLVEHRQKREADRFDEHEHALEQRLTALVRAIPPDVLMRGLAPLLEDPPRNEELDVLLRLFGDSHATDETSAELPNPARELLGRYFKSAVAAVLEREDFRGEAKAYLATALAEFGSAAEIEDVLALIRADIERMRTGRELRRRDIRTPQAEGAFTSYSAWHVQALVRLDAARAETILCELLSEPEYDVDAAWGLRTLAKNDLGPRRKVDGRFGGPRRDYRTVRQTPPEWVTLFDASRREKYAAAICDRLAYLLAESSRTPDAARSLRWRAKELAKPLAELDPSGSANLILEIASIPFDVGGWGPVGLLESLVFGRVTLEAERTLAIIEPSVEYLRKHGTYNDNAGLVQHLLCLLPFVDPPARGVERARALLEEFRVPSYERRDVFVALAQCPDESGLVLLSEIGPQNAGSEYAVRDWLRAVSASPHQQARRLLLSIVDPDVREGIGEVGGLGDAHRLLAEILAEIARVDSDVAARIFGLCASRPGRQARSILAKVCAVLGTPEALYAALNLMDDALEPSIPYEVMEAAEGVFLEKRPSRQMPNAYSLVPRAASDVRIRLFEMAQHDTQRRQSAADLLARIEQWRLEHGRPPSEPRHPLYSSGISWPMPIERAPP